MPAMSDSVPKRPGGRGGGPHPWRRTACQRAADARCDRAPAHTAEAHTGGDHAESDLLAGLVVGEVARHLGREHARRDRVDVDAWRGAHARAHAQGEPRRRDHECQVVDADGCGGCAASGRLKAVPRDVNWAARTRVRWATAALEAAYAYALSNLEVLRPAMELTLITRAGSSGVDAACSNGRQLRVVLGRVARPPSHENRKRSRSALARVARHRRRTRA